MARSIWMALSIGLGLALSACGAADGAAAGSVEQDGATLGTTTPGALDGGQESEIGSVAQPLVRGSGGGAGGLGYSCSGLVCTCTGDLDCNDMFGDGVCGDVSSCDVSNPLEPVCTCLSLRARATTSIAAQPGALRAAR